MNFEKVERAGETWFRIRHVFHRENTPKVYYSLHDEINGVLTLVGWVGVSRISPLITEIRHLYVRKDYRGSGYGVELLKRVVKKIMTPVICATVKTNNERSIQAFTVEGFAMSLPFINAMSGNQLVLMLKIVDVPIPTANRDIMTGDSAIEESEPST